MLQLYSKGCEHVIRAMMNIRLEECRSGFSARVICKKVRLPESFTRKIFQALVKSGVLSAKRGPGGGYRFRKDPAKVSLLSVIYAIDGKDVFDKCVIKDMSCEQAGHCSLHATWMKTKASLIKQLRDSTIAQLIEGGA